MASIGGGGTCLEISTTCRGFFSAAEVVPSVRPAPPMIAMVAWDDNSRSGPSHLLLAVIRLFHSLCRRRCTKQIFLPFPTFAWSVRMGVVQESSRRVGTRNDRRA
eukprot:CAMPEP_0178490476 /NCGR_PEP_ID=MMETSP0696-20121128/10910_1 /TAXON_ID=265572 /ORGANISM="Extubocellulus spinifer, Strain CCMP396" /LENGTH=104 /DNA_ID=CAMNT_0020118307 /DNA_START=308 /DNA_END=622 /DNA_ORIENTATION=-